MTRLRLFEQPPFIPVFEDYSYFQGKSIGVTGQGGVLGRILSERLVSQGIRVEGYLADITDVRSLETWFKEHGFDYFFHFAGIVPTSKVMDDPLKAYDVNVIGSYNICKQIIATQANCWLFLASSSHVYKNSPLAEQMPLAVGSAKDPSTFYGATKLAAERICAPILDKYGVDYCIGRIFSFSSIIQKEPYLVPTLRRRIEELSQHDVLEIVNPDSVRDIMDADTVIDCVLHLAQRRFKGIINIGSGKAMSIKDIALHLMKLLGEKNQICGVNQSPPDSLVADVQTLREVLSKRIEL